MRLPAAARSLKTRPIQNLQVRQQFRFIGTYHSTVKRAENSFCKKGLNREISKIIFFFFFQSLILQEQQP